MQKSRTLINQSEPTNQELDVIEAEELPLDSLEMLKDQYIALLFFCPACRKRELYSSNAKEFKVACRNCSYQRVDWQFFKSPEKFKEVNAELAERYIKTFLALKAEMDVHAALTENIPFAHA